MGDVVSLSKETWIVTMTVRLPMPTDGMAVGEILLPLLENFRRTAPVTQPILDYDIERDGRIGTRHDDGTSDVIIDFEASDAFVAMINEARLPPLGGITFTVRRGVWVRGVRPTTVLVDILSLNLREIASDCQDAGLYLIIKDADGSSINLDEADLTMLHTVAMQALIHSNGGRLELPQLKDQLVAALCTVYPGSSIEMVSDHYVVPIVLRASAIEETEDP